MKNIISDDAELKVMLQVDDIAIRYKIGDFKDIGLKEWVTRHLTGNFYVKNFMAVQDVSFSINKGDLLGIIGTNGAGKSTLLKAISGIMAPTRGKITAGGNVVALLELASGFDGNLTVKENAYLRGAMLGYTEKFMSEAYDHIIEFAELKDFEERPFKQLSSGMQARLAFSIASMVQPEILILDEVLSVGDGAFRVKSEKKMREIINGGATTILVSHSLEQIRQMCNKVLWLHKGKQVAFGEADEICNQYQGFLSRGSSLTSSISIPTLVPEKRDYDYLIVGAGLFGSVFAHEAKKFGMKCLVIDRRRHIGGNVYTEKIADINVHKYGAHIFHTSNEAVWKYITQFTEFNQYTNAPLAVYKGEVYNLPFNMNTFNKIWGVKTPAEAKAKIEEQIADLGIKDPQNLEEQALSLVGRDVYEKLIKGYTEKQWGRDCKDLPSFIIKRLPVRFTYDNNYFNDKYQGVPVGGYTPMVEKLIEGTDFLLNTDYSAYIKEHPHIARKIIYTGCIDEYFNYSLGVLEYRSLRFRTEEQPVQDFQGNAVVNYTEREVPYTRIIEHKHFEFGTQPTTVITYEYPLKWEKGDEPYYPINDAQNGALFEQYLKLAENERDVLFRGRLGQYRYYDMDDVIAAALETVKKEFS